MNSPILFLAALAPLLAQTPPARPQPIVSPEVSADKRITFRLRAPNAKQVFVQREGAARLEMQKGEDGVFTVTTDPVEPDLYGYTFSVDGVGILDPSNSQMKPNLLNPQSVVHVPGAGLQWEVADVPHGTVNHHRYHSQIVGDDRDYYVYTPPNYDPRAKTVYPVFYLLHGYSDDASGWTAVGQAHVILDNLIAQGKARPMLVVMTLGYGVPGFASKTGPAFSDPGLRKRSFDRFRDSVLNEVMPQVEKDYRAATDRTKRAIAGLSMGGAETLYIGLNALDRFAYLGAFSSGGLGADFAEQFPKLDESANKQLRLFWVSCGKEDRLLDFNNKFVEFANSRKVDVKLRVTGGAHTWMVWRRNLVAFAPLLFQD